MRLADWITDAVNDSPFVRSLALPWALCCLPAVAFVAGIPGWVWPLLIGAVAGCFIPWH